MSVVPKKILQKMQWLEDHVEPFNLNAVAIGTTVLEAAAFQTKTEAARAALTAATAARSASKNATLTLKTALEAADIAAAGIVKQVGVRAETTHNPDVYALASLPAPAQPSPIGPLATASDFTVGLEVTGALNLTWKATQPTNATAVTYQIWRRIGHTGPFVCLGGVGAKNFQDATVPAGSAVVTYQIQATRSTSVSPWAQFVVSFGMDSAGATVATVTQGTPVNLAA